MEKIKLDLHLHTKYSHDGTLEPEKIVKLSIRKGLQGIAITDHDTIRGAIEVRKLKKDLLVILGSEIRTERGEVMGLFLNEEIKNKNFLEVLDQIRAQDGIVVVPHPFDKMRSSTFTPSENDVEYFDGIEVFNARCIFQKYNKIALEFALSNGISMTAGSDAHFANEIGLAGIIVTASDEEEIRKAILKRKVEYFGKKSSILNHGATKVIKLWRRLRRSGSP